MEATLYPSDGSTQIRIGSLAEPRAQAILEISRQQSRSLQVFHPLRAAAPSVFDRITRVNRFGFPAQKLHDDQGAAFLYVATHPDRVPNTATIKFTNGVRTLWLLECGIEEVNLVQYLGLTTIFSYAIIGGTWSTTAPP